MCPVDQILVGIVLLLMWSTNLPPIQPRFHLLDLFAGGAAATKVWNLHCGLGIPCRMNS